MKVQTPPNAPLLMMWFSLPYRLEEKKNDNKGHCRKRRVCGYGTGN